MENCLTSAARLKRDSRLVSRPSKAALLELALEEIGKSSVLCLRLFATRRQEDPHPLLSEEGEALKTALIKIATPGEVNLIREAHDIPAFVQMTNLDELFEKHPPKVGRSRETCEDRSRDSEGNQEPPQTVRRCHEGCTKTSFSPEGDGPSAR